MGYIGPFGFSIGSLVSKIADLTHMIDGTLLFYFNIISIFLFAETTNLSEVGSSSNGLRCEAIEVSVTDPLRCRGLEDEVLQDYNLRRTNSLRHAKKVNFSLKHKLRKHLSQRAPTRLALGKVNETFSDSSQQQVDVRSAQLKPISFWNWNVAGDSTELHNGETLIEADIEPSFHMNNNNTHNRHQSLDTRTLEDLDSKLRAKFSLPDSFASECLHVTAKTDREQDDFDIGGNGSSVSVSRESTLNLDIPTKERKCKQSSWCCNQVNIIQPPTICSNLNRFATNTTNKPKQVAIESAKLKAKSFWDWNGGSDAVRSTLVQDNFDLDLHINNHYRQIRHRSLDTRTLLDMDRQQSAKLPPTGYSTPFPLISLKNMSGIQQDFESETQQASVLSSRERLQKLEVPAEGSRCKQSSGSCRELDPNSLSAYYLNSTSVEMKGSGKTRPQSCCIFKVEPGPCLKEIRVNSLFDKFHWDGMRSKRSSACKSLLEYDTNPLQTETWLRSSDSVLNGTSRGLRSGLTTRKSSIRNCMRLQRTSSAETGLKAGKKMTDLEVTSTGVRVRTRPTVLRTRSWRPNMKHLKGPSFRKSDKRWSYLEMSEFSSLESGPGLRTPDCSESTRLTLGTPSTGGATFGSDRSYTSSTMTILKSFEELHDIGPIHSICGSENHSSDGYGNTTSPASNECEPAHHCSEGNENCMTTVSSIDQSPLHLNEGIELAVSRVDQVNKHLL